MAFEAIVLLVICRATPRCNHQVSPQWETLAQSFYFDQDGFAVLELFSSLPIWVEDASVTAADLPLPDMEVLSYGPGILTLCHLVAETAETAERDGFTKRTKSWSEVGSTRLCLQVENQTGQ